MYIYYGIYIIHCALNNNRIQHTPECMNPYFLKGFEIIPNHVIPVQVVENFSHPFHHELVIFPSLHKLLQKELIICIPQRGRNRSRNILQIRPFISFIKLL